MKERLLEAHLHLERFVEDFTNALYEGLQGRLTKTLCSPADIQRVTKTAEKFALDHRLTGVNGTGINVIGSPKSIVVTSRMLRVVFHVPLQPVEDSTLELLRLRSSVDIFGEGGRRAQPKNQLIAVDLSGRVATLSAEELNLCERYHGYYVCEDHRLLSGVPYDCVSALYKAKDLELCASDIGALPLAAPLPLRPGLFWASSGEVALDCEGTDARKFVWGEEQARAVSGECRVAAPSFVIRRQPAAATAESFFAKLRRDDLPDLPEEQVARSLSSFQEELAAVRANLSATAEVAPLEVEGHDYYLWLAIGLGAAFGGTVFAVLASKFLTFVVELRRVAASTKVGRRETESVHAGPQTEKVSEGPRAQAENIPCRAADSLLSLAAPAAEIEVAPAALISAAIESLGK